MLKNSIPLNTVTEASLPLILLWNVEKFSKGTHRSIRPEFSLVLRSFLTLRILQWLSTTDCLETHKLCLIFELERCRGFFGCFFSCNIYHRAEAFGLLYMRLQTLKGQAQAQLTSLPVSLKLSRKQPSPRAARLSRQAAVLSCTYALCPAALGFGRPESCPQLRQTPSTRVAATPSVRREGKVVVSSLVCAQCSSPTGTEDTRETVTAPDQHLSWCHRCHTHTVQQHRPCQDHCERFTRQLVCV